MSGKKSSFTRASEVFSGVLNLTKATIHGIGGNLAPEATSALDIAGSTMTNLGREVQRFRSAAGRLDFDDDKRGAVREDLASAQYAFLSAVEQAFELTTKMSKEPSGLVDVCDSENEAATVNAGAELACHIAHTLHTAAVMVVKASNESVCSSIRPVEYDGLRRRSEGQEDIDIRLVASNGNPDWMDESMDSLAAMHAMRPDSGFNASRTHSHGRQGAAAW